MGWVLENPQALLRKKGHHVPIAALEGDAALHRSNVTLSQGKFHVATPHLSAYGLPSGCHLQPLIAKSAHQYPQAIPPQNC